MTFGPQFAHLPSGNSYNGSQADDHGAPYQSLNIPYSHTAMDINSNFDPLRVGTHSHRYALPDDVDDAETHARRTCPPVR